MIITSDILLFIIRIEDDNKSMKSFTIIITRSTINKKTQKIVDDKVKVHKNKIEYKVENIKEYYNICMNIMIHPNKVDKKVEEIKICNR